MMIKGMNSIVIFFYTGLRQLSLKKSLCDFWVNDCKTCIKHIYLLEVKLKKMKPVTQLFKLPVFKANQLSLNICGGLSFSMSTTCSSWQRSPWWRWLSCGWSCSGRHISVSWPHYWPPERYILETNILWFISDDLFHDE